MASKKVKKMFGGGLNNLASAIQKQPFAGQMRQAVGMDDRPAGAMPQRSMPSQSNFGGRLRGLDRAAAVSGKPYRGAPPAQTLGSRNLPTASPSASAPSTQLNALQGALAGSPTQAPPPAPTLQQAQMTQPPGGISPPPGGFQPNVRLPMKKGGSVKAKYSIDGIAQRGKTRAKLKGK